MIHKLEVKLKQHTPLIHFQHDQEGATLRASEVKPKLDKFVLTRLCNGDYKSGTDYAKTKGWLVGKGDHMALDYKMKIVLSGEKEEFLLASYIRRDDINVLGNQGINAISGTSFFAQEKQNGEVCRSRAPRDNWARIEKKGILAGNIHITMISADIDLIEALSTHIQTFFAATNFGTRQSKGFGCFSVLEVVLDDKIINLDDIEYLLKRVFKFVYKKQLGPNSNMSNVLSTINNDYKLLKSGRTRPYAKSKLMLYAERLNPNIGWDKKFIKANTNGQFLNENNIPYELKCEVQHRQAAYTHKNSYIYYRAVLGLAEQFEFLLDNPPQNNPRNKMIVKVKNEEINRYQSPVIFKVSDDAIYLAGNEVSMDVLDKPFDFLVNFQNDSGYENEPVDQDNPIRTPNEFSLSEFIEFAITDNTNNASLGYIRIE